MADKLCCAESSVWHWIRRFRGRWIGLLSLPAGRGRYTRWHLAPLCPLLSYLLTHTPQQFCYRGS
ncbi:hypothetical protein [Xenorhabdus sp. IM139775]|uniref:hypothetical protein n=1 Tax=Xenorhabdus sp. IM139775 TaxID=3025876 RepID=UPI002358B9ED|nr:hypothetical protein [Xenorhabdus sp. IM139775]MDC9592798.1 hypothetical protein [Xenorhabdus sp. IM139775]